MSDFQFAEPHWIHLIWPVLVFLGLLTWFDQRGNTNLDRWISPTMQKRLVLRQSGWRRLSVIGLLGLSAFALVLALMRPQWGFHYERTPKVGAQLMIALDVSRSMLAEDVAPNRLERAKAEIQDLLGYLSRDHVGLIAFAGRATVLCPLTPDFGFFRLVLESVGPHSVTRGGTNLEEPIRKALAGFRGQSDLSRIILMITDGEDHDSFALEAAKAAAERGIHIITIGVGDEGGSRVLVTDPKTGARTQLLDGNGQPVVTRLDGDLLRKIALETSGVYIPAATGALDLKSIYQTHIAPLTRSPLEDRGRLVRQEGFQWAVLLAIIFLITATIVSSGRMGFRPAMFDLLGATTACVLIFFFILTVSFARAQNPSDTPTPPGLDQGAQTGEESWKDRGARELYNDAVLLSQAEKWDDAEKRFSQARQKAGSDGPTRYRSTYNLGWVEVKLADGLIKDQPQKALARLKSAAGWFREAVRLEPHETAARENLELVMRRVLVLVDTLDKRDKDDLAQQLEELIQGQRELTRLIQGTVERVAPLEEPTLPEHLKSDFRSLKIEQGKLLSRLEEVVLNLRDEADRLKAVDESERTPEQNIRLVQLQNVMAYLHRSGQHMGQARRQLRERQAERAYRRVSSSLGELKRARDQLRNLVQVLRRIIDDATLLTQQTGEVADAVASVPGASQNGTARPGWLTREFLQDVLIDVEGRTGELVARVDAGLKAEESPAAQEEGKEDSSTEHEKRRRQALLRALREAQPVMQEAQDAFKQAGGALAEKRYRNAYENEARGTTLLFKVRELFLDIRGLIEVIYGDETYMKALLIPDDGKEVAKVVKISESLPLLGELQFNNIQRGKRLGRMLDGELETLKQPEEGGTTAAATEEEAKRNEETRRRQIQLAKDILNQTLGSFAETESAIKGIKGNQVKTEDLQRLGGLVDQGIEQVEALRRIFFSILEHLRETAQRQAALADETRDVATLADESKMVSGIAPLIPRQQDLSNVTRQIADSLEKQSEQSPSNFAGQGSGGKSLDTESQDAAHRLAQASQHVTGARQAMDQATQKMKKDPQQLKTVEEDQGAAVQKLAEAIQLLSPPPKEPKQQQQEQQQQAQQQDQEAAKQKQEQQQAQQMDMNHLLQSVRDREAQRRRDKRQRSSAGYAPVEKDW